ncbi:MAG: hypothetical protein DCC55_13275 [Chloroflexi bacterium]|nr:MAG: hypothetical protein DCC55_13275 [Chloroflexota bacterium]
MNKAADLNLYTTVDDELYDELNELTEQKVVHVELWEDSLADALGDKADSAAPDTLFDLDLYLEDGVYFELYGTQCFTDPDDEPWRGLETVQRQLIALVKRGLWLVEVAVTAEDGLVLVLGQAEAPQLYLEVGGWLIEEWDELPDV